MSPNSTWKCGDKIVTPFTKTVALDLSAISSADAYKIMIGSIVPRPIAFVSTLSHSGVGNLAPFSFFNGVSSEPPIVMFSISRKPNGEKKDTLRNIEDTGEFVINIVSSWLAEPMAYAAGLFPFGVNEMEVVGLTAEPSHVVKPPRVKESAVQFECKLHTLVPMGNNDSTVVFGELLIAHLAEEVFQDGKILSDKLDPLARLGGYSYGLVRERFELKPPHVKE